MVIAPQTLQEALSCLAEPGYVPVAGGTDWMVSHAPEGTPVFLHRIEALATLRETGGGLFIGPCCTYAALLSDPRVPGALREAIRGIAAPAVRNLGTIGGNIANASPAGDTLPILYALDAEVTLMSARGTRTLPIGAFITGVKRTRRAPDELLTRIFLPLFQGTYAYHKVGARRAQAISKCSFVGFIAKEGDTVRDLRIAFGAAAPAVVRSRALEEALIGLPLSAARAKAAETASGYGALLSPIDDARSTAAYRRQALLNLLGAFLQAQLA